MTAGKDGLKQTVISGGRWMLLRQLISQPIRIIVSIILTRIIAPSDFGIVAKALAITGIIEMVLMNGLNGSIIQRKVIDQKELNSLFIFSCVVSLLLSAGIFVLANPIALFYTDERVEWVVQLAAFTIFVSGIRIVFDADLNKQLEFRKLAMINIIATIISSVLAILLAYFNYGYKSLIYQILALNMIITVGTIIGSKWKPTFDLRLKGIVSHLAYGGNVAFNNVLNYAVRNTDNVAIGKFQSNLDLGYYSRAYFLMLLPINLVGQIFNSTLFPIFSKIQNDRDRILAILNQVQELVLLTIYPLVIFTFFNIDYIVLKVLGSNWIPSVIYFKVFTPLIFVQLITIQINLIYMSLNKMSDLSKISLVFKPIILLAIVVASMYQTLSVAMVLVTLSIISGCYTYVKGIQYLGLSSFNIQIRYLKNTLLSLLGFIGVQFTIYYFVGSGLLLAALTFLILVLYYLALLKYKSGLKGRIREFLKLD